MVYKNLKDKSHYRKTGMAKMGYPTQELADKAIKDIKKKYGTNMRSYVCPKCKMLHLARDK